MIVFLFAARSLSSLLSLSGSPRHHVPVLCPAVAVPRRALLLILALPLPGVVLLLRRCRRCRRRIGPRRREERPEVGVGHRLRARGVGCAVADAVSIAAAVRHGGGPSENGRERDERLEKKKKK